MCTALGTHLLRVLLVDGLHVSHAGHPRVAPQAVQRLPLARVLPSQLLCLGAQALQQAARGGLGVLEDPQLPQVCCMQGGMEPLNLRRQALALALQNGATLAPGRDLL